MQTTAITLSSVAKLNDNPTTRRLFGLLILHPDTGAAAVIDKHDDDAGHIGAIIAELDGTSERFGTGTITLQLDTDDVLGWVFAFSDDGAPICPTCKVNECADASEPGHPGFFSKCSRCMNLTGTRPVGGELHCHTHRYTQAQLDCERNWIGGTKPAPDHTWPTAVSVRPTFVDGIHTGFRCNAHEPCGWTTTELR